MYVTGKESLQSGISPGLLRTGPIRGLRAGGNKDKSPARFVRVFLVSHSIPANFFATVGVLNQGRAHRNGQSTVKGKWFLWFR